jgi:hypothetical protein
VQDAGSLGTTGWHLTFPAAWNTQTLPACPGYSATGLIATNAAFTFRNPSGGFPKCGDRLVLAGFPRDGVAFALAPAGIGFGLDIGTFDTPFPIGWTQLEPSGGIRGGPAESYLVIRIHGEPTWNLRTWIGQDASSSAIADVKAAVTSLTVRGAAHWTTYSSPDRRFSVAYPDEWFRAPRSLMPPTTTAQEILSLASYRAAAGGHACTDVPLPGNALMGLGFGGVFVTVQETGSPSAPPRPSRLGAGDAQETWDSIPGCNGKDPVHLRAWWIPFHDQGRSFNVFVALGPGVAHDGQVLRVVSRVLRSLRFQSTDRSPETAPPDGVRSLSCVFAVDAAPTDLTCKQAVAVATRELAGLGQQVDVLATRTTAPDGSAIWNVKMSGVLIGLAGNTPPGTPPSHGMSKVTCSIADISVSVDATTGRAVGSGFRSGGTPADCEAGPGRPLLNPP